MLYRYVAVHHFTASKQNVAGKSWFSASYHGSVRRLRRPVRRHGSNTSALWGWVTASCVLSLDFGELYLACCSRPAMAICMLVFSASSTHYIMNISFGGGCWCLSLRLDTGMWYAVCCVVSYLGKWSEALEKWAASTLIVLVLFSRSMQ